MKLLEKNKSKISRNENGENVPHLEITEKLVHYNIVNNNYQQDSRILFTFIPNKSFGQQLDISPTNFRILKTCNSCLKLLKLLKPLKFNLSNRQQIHLKLLEKEQFKKQQIGNEIADKVTKVSRTSPQNSLEAQK